jgi:hypothetical protein
MFIVIAENCIDRLVFALCSGTASQAAGWHAARIWNEADIRPTKGLVNGCNFDF